MSNLEFLQDIFKRNLIGIVGIGVAIASIVGSALYVYYNKEECPVCEAKECEKFALNEEESTSGTIKVDVKGAVKKPGVYELLKGTNIQDAIKSAGGVTSKGTTSNINLSKHLENEMVVYVFTKDELKAKETANEVVCEIPKCECETISVQDSLDKVNGNSSSDKNVQEGKVSINKASAKELTNIDGIGESKANAIIEYREKNGPFKSIEDIKKVSGIGDALYDKIKNHITI